MGKQEESGSVVRAAVCPGCDRGNPPENNFCGHCGTFLGSRPALLERLPVERLGPAGRALALSLAVTAAEAGVRWLGHKLGRSAGKQPAGTDPGRGTPDGPYEYLYAEVSVLFWNGKTGRGWRVSEARAGSTRTTRTTRTGGST